MDRPRAKGLIFCFPHQKDFHPNSEFNDPCAKDIWFANQLCDDACATQAILNVLMNAEDVHLGAAVQQFKLDTAEFDSVVSGVRSGCSRAGDDDSWRSKGSQSRIRPYSVRHTTQSHGMSQYVTLFHTVPEWL